MFLVYKLVLNKRYGFSQDYEKAFYWHKVAVQRGNKHSRGDMIRLKSILYKKNR